MDQSQATIARLSLISISITGVVTAIHHIYRLGLEVLIPFGIVIALPLLLMYLYQTRGHQWLLWGYSLFNALIIFWFGFLDGFLDHTVKILGFQNITFLEGSDAEVVQTVFSLWSPEAGALFYEWTGVITFVASIFALVYTHQLMRKPANRPSQTALQAL